MSGRGIQDLGTPPSRFRVDRGVNGRRGRFETVREKRKEDLFRARRLRRTANKFAEQIDVKCALRLAARLEKGGGGTGVPETLASSVYMRGVRIKTCGALWQLIKSCRRLRVRAVTIIPKTWEFTPDELMEVDPRKLMKALLAALYSRGAGDANGWFIASIHGEYDPIGGVYRLHVHCFAYGEMVKVINRLRCLPNYRTRMYLADGRLSPVYRRIRMTQKRLRFLPRIITYLMQSYWPSRALIISDDGERMRGRWKRRIPEPYHSQVLLWLDRWQISDLTLMIGLRVTQAGLIQTKPVS
jgi:hypothetical protein